MADSKISALPASTTPLAGTEVLPIVQSSATKQVSVANLTAGRAISATQLTLTTGNLIVASGQGIDFSATSGAGTSELFNDYEEGTWTPTLALTSGSVGYSSRDGKYTKVGSVVTLNTWIALSSVSSPTGNLSIALPYAMGATATRPACFILSNNLTLVVGQTAGWMYQSDNILYLVISNNGVFTSLTGTNLASNSELYVSITYTIA